MGQKASMCCVGKPDEATGETPRRLPMCPPNTEKVEEALRAAAAARRKREALASGGAPGEGEPGASAAEEAKGGEGAGLASPPKTTGVRWAGAPGVESEPDNEPATEEDREEAPPPRDDDSSKSGDATDPEQDKAAAAERTVRRRREAELRRVRQAMGLRGGSGASAGAGSVGILGGTVIQKSFTEALVRELAEGLPGSLDQGTIFVTSGTPGVQQLFARHCGDAARLWNLLPQSHPGGYASGVGGSVHAGETMQEHRELYCQLCDVYLCVEGGPAVSADARAVLDCGGVVVPVPRTGGASSGMFGFPAAALERPPFALQAQWRVLRGEGGDADASSPEATVEAVTAVVQACLRHRLEGGAAADEEGPVTGTWEYGGDTPKRYLVEETPQGTLRFEGPHSLGGALISGELRPRGEFLEADLSLVDGQRAGSIRLRRGEAADGEAVLISNFKGCGMRDWGKDIAARRVRPAAADAAAAVE